MPGSHFLKRRREGGAGLVFAASRISRGGPTGQAPDAADAA
ncbi:hypothetical protein BGLA2_2040012 [Burkholderia gladioli]|nr:hypothetical protein BGLA2_2040012 [Burkholderia gladioli]